MKPELIIMCGELSVPDCREAKGLVLWKNEQEYSDGARGKACAGMKRQCQEKCSPSSPKSGAGLLLCCRFYAMSGRLSDDKKNRGRRFRLSLSLFDVLLESSGIYAMSTVLQEGCRYVVRSMSSLPVLSQSLLLPKKRRR